MSRKELTNIPTQNKDIVTSFVYTWARQKEMTILEQRVVLRIMEFASNHLKGIKPTMWAAPRPYSARTA